MIEREKLQHLIENIGIPKLCLILLLGISLIIVSIPSGKTKKNTQSSETTAKEDSTDLYVKKQERRLVNALKHVEGVGKVKVMITVNSSKEAVVNKDSPYEQSSSEKENGGFLTMKKVFQKNQMIIMTLAVVIAVAGYVNYSQKYDPAGTKNSKAKTVSKNVAKESAAAVTDDVTDVGEAVLTNAQVSNYVAKAKLEREQTHSKAKDTLEEIIKDQTVKDSVKQDAVDKLAMLSEQMEMETAAENLLGAKGFLNSIVTITNGKVDVLVNKKDLSKVERSQIEDIVVRKVGCQLGDVVISSIKTEE